eukprot:655997_1
MPRKKRWSHIKKRGKSCYKRVSFKQREKNYNDTKFNKNINRKTKPKRKIKLKLKLNKKQNKKVIRAAVSSVRSPLSIISQNHNTVRRPSISPYTHAVNQNKRPPTAICQADVSITWNDVGKQNRVLHHQVSQLKKRLYASERRNILYQHDIAKLINESSQEEPQSQHSLYLPKLSADISSNINIITEKTFHPQFAAAFNDLGILVSFQRRQLKQRLGDLLRNNTAYTVSRINSWGLDKRQLKLYEYCIEMVRRNGALQVRH